LRRRLGAALLTGVLAGACATPQTDSLRRQAAHTPAPPGAHAHLLTAVPFFPQERQQCGPATLAMALGAAGVPATPEELRDLVFVPGRGGSLATEMLVAARRRGLLALTLPPALDAVLHQVDEGHPVIVLQNLGLWFYPVWHYALIIGYDIDRDQVVLHSGPEPRQVLSMELFERTWARSGRWAMIAVDPRRPPQSLDMASVLEATAALERVDAGAAHAAYQALTARADASFAAWMGLGNSAYAQGDAAAAVNAFETATRLAPDRAEAWNNLAVGLLALGAPARAHAAIAHALALGGTQLGQYEQTAREIEAATPHP